MKYLLMIYYIYYIFNTDLELLYDINDAKLKIKFGILAKYENNRGMNSRK